MFPEIGVFTEKLGEQINNFPFNVFQVELIFLDFSSSLALFIELANTFEFGHITHRVCGKILQ